MTENSATQSLMLPNSPPSNASVTCDPEPAYWAIGMVVVPLVQLIVNGVVFVATFRSRKKLRHNYVYAYVMNVLMGNIVFAISSFYNALNYVLVFERIWRSPNPFRVDWSNSGQATVLMWWSFRSSFNAGVYLLINANVSALIYGVSGSAYLVGRYSENSENFQNESISRRRYKAIAIISMNWLLAIGASLSGTFNPCVQHCLCVYTDYGSFDPCHTDNYPECSRIWPPVTKQFLLSVAVIWCVEMLLIIGMLVGAMRKSMMMIRPKVRNPPTSQVDVYSTSFKKEITPPEDGCIDPSDPNSTSQITSKKKKKQMLTNWGLSNLTIRFLIILALFFLVTNLPAIVVAFVDVFNRDDVIPSGVVPAVLVITTVYGLLLPLLMVYYMSRLRQAVQSLLLAIKCCTVTEQKRPRAT